MSSTPAHTESSSPERSTEGGDVAPRTWVSFLYRHWKWLAGLMVLGLIIDFLDGDEGDPPSPKAESSRSEPVKPQHAEATIPAKEMADVLRQAFTLRLGMTTSDLMRSLGQSPTATKVTNPADHTIPGLPIIDPRPFTIYTWNSAENPDDTFVMVLVKEDRVCEVSVYKNGGETLNLSPSR